MGCESVFVCGNPVGENQILYTMKALGDPIDLDCLNEEQKQSFYNGINRIVRDLQKEICGLIGNETQLSKVMQAAIPKIKALRLEYPSCGAEARLEERVGFGGVHSKARYEIPEYDPLKQCLDDKAKEHLPYMINKGITESVAKSLAGMSVLNGGIVMEVQLAITDANLGVPQATLEEVARTAADHARECGTPVVEIK